MDEGVPYLPYLNDSVCSFYNNKLYCFYKLFRETTLIFFLRKITDFFLCSACQLSTTSPSALNHLNPPVAKAKFCCSRYTEFYPIQEAGGIKINYVKTSK